MSSRSRGQMVMYDQDKPGREVAVLREYRRHPDRIVSAEAHEPAEQEVILHLRLTRPLFDTSRYTRNFEAALDAAFERHLRGDGPGDMRLHGLPSP